MQSARVSVSSPVSGKIKVAVKEKEGSIFIIQLPVL
jgi:hypothetical protein